MDTTAQELRRKAIVKITQVLIKVPEDIKALAEAAKSPPSPKRMDQIAEAKLLALELLKKAGFDETRVVIEIQIKDPDPWETLEVPLGSWIARLPGDEFKALEASCKAAHQAYLEYSDYRGFTRRPDPELSEIVFFCLWGFYLDQMVG